MNYDVVIIGASTAGLYAAELLVKAGKNVILFEREQTISPANRTYIITPGLFRIMPDFPRELIRHEISEIHVQAQETSTAIQLAVPDLVIDRGQLIRTMLLRAEKAGVEVIAGSEFQGIEGSGRDLSLKIRSKGEDRYLQTTCLIGADGVNSQVRSWAGLRELDWAPLLQAEINLPEDWDDQVTKVWFDRVQTPYFFWLIPDRDKKAVVGLISPRGSNPRKLLDDFLKEHNFSPSTYQAGQAALYTRGSSNSTRLGSMDVFLVGDAAGQVKVTTVGGTVTGFSGAKAAVEEILGQRHYRRSLLAVQNELNLHSLIRQLLDNMTPRDYRILIGSISPAVKRFLLHYHRDEMRWNFWKLIFIQPRFIPLGLQLLFRVLKSGFQVKSQ